METAVGKSQNAVAPHRTKGCPDESEPTWEVAYLFPRQGKWSEEEYFSLPGHRLVEFSHGWIEVLPMPTEEHQSIVLFLVQALWSFVQAHSLGKVLFSGIRVRLWEGKYREPDVVFMRAEHASRRHEQFWEGADLVMEVVSPDYRQHDLVTKRREYAWAGIPEYWIVDPEEKQIQVLVLDGRSYRLHGVFTSQMRATSVQLPGFSVVVDEVFTAAEK